MTYTTEDRAREAKAEAKRAARAEQLGDWQQQQEQFQQEKAARMQESDREVRELIARRERIAQGLEKPPVVPTLLQVHERMRDERVEAARQAEEARIAALSPRDIWLSTLPFGERQRIAKWEQINKIPYPMVGS